MTGTDFRATIERILEGYPVGTGGKAQCCECHRTVREGDPVSVYAYQMVGDQQWTVTSLRCGSCRRSELTGPTLGAHEFLADARLAVTADCATQTSHLTLRNVEQHYWSEPDSGHELYCNAE